MRKSGFKTLFYSYCLIFKNRIHLDSFSSGAALPCFSISVQQFLAHRFHSQLHLSASLCLRLTFGLEIALVRECMPPGVSLNQNINHIFSPVVKEFYRNSWKVLSKTEFPFSTAIIYSLLKILWFPLPFFPY
jgi:hypothetical protein